MRLLINAIPLLGEESGVGTYTRNVASRILTAVPEWDLDFFYGYTSKKLKEPALPGKQGFLDSCKSVIKKASLFRRIAKKTLQLGNLAIRKLSSKTWDCYFEPNFVLLPGFPAASRIITIHDFSCFRFPQWHPLERVRYMEKNFWPSVQKSTAIITVSHAIRKEAIEIYGMEADKITAIPNGVNHNLYYPRSALEIENLVKKYNLPENFILFVGTLEPRKNLANLITAHANLPESLRRNYPLVIIGGKGWNNSEIQKLISRERNYVRVMGYVPHFSLPSFYSAAALFAYPSSYEGFGLPVLEAMACGCPVLASKIPALEELCKNTACLAEPEDPGAITSQLKNMLEDEALRNKLKNDGLKRAAAYSWDASADTHLRLFKSMDNVC